MRCGQLYYEAPALIALGPHNQSLPSHATEPPSAYYLVFCFLTTISSSPSSSSVPPPPPPISSVSSPASVSIHSVGTLTCSRSTHNFPFQHISRHIPLVRDCFHTALIRVVRFPGAPVCFLQAHDPPLQMLPHPLVLVPFAFHSLAGYAGPCLLIGLLNAVMEASRAYKNHQSLSSSSGWSTFATCHHSPAWCTRPPSPPLPAPWPAVVPIQHTQEMTFLRAEPDGLMTAHVSRK